MAKGKWSKREVDRLIEKEPKFSYGGERRMFNGGRGESRLRGKLSKTGELG